LEAGPWQIVWETLFRKKKSQKRAGGVAQGVGSEFILHYHTHTHIQMKVRRLASVKRNIKGI
jgi:hypothetical protein